MNIEIEYWYSARFNYYSIADECGDHYSTSGPVPTYERYEVIRHTPKGVWLRLPFSAQFFVLGTAKRQTAVPTKALAVQDLIARKRQHVRHAARRLKDAEAELKLAINTYEGMPK